LYVHVYVCFDAPPQRRQSTHKRGPSSIEYGNHMNMLMSYMLISMTKDTFAYRNII